MSVSVATPRRSAGRPRRLSVPRSWTARVAILVLALVMGVALFGPFVAPHAPADLLGAPYAGPSTEFPLGTDGLGRDVLSRLLWGGRSVLGLAVLATLLAYVIGGAIGLVAGYSRSRFDGILMRCVDVLLAFPPLLFLLLLAAGLGAGGTTIVLGVAIVNVPGIARVVRTATLEATTRGYVEAAVARGERVHFLLVREVLPNITGTIVADGGVRLTGSILAVAGLNFLGLGLQPPAADWATMIAENRGNITLQPWSLAAPAVMIALLTLSLNLAADALSRSLGRSSEGRE